VEVSLRGRPAGGVELRVCDFGRGLAPDWATRSQAGGGLGMRVIRAMLERIGAVLEVAEGAAPGTCFTVSA
jgi:signal transduction histidine kinase